MCLCMFINQNCGNLIQSGRRLGNCKGPPVCISIGANFLGLEPGEHFGFVVDHTWGRAWICRCRRDIQRSLSHLGCSPSRLHLNHLRHLGISPTFKGLQTQWFSASLNGSFHFLETLVIKKIEMNLNKGAKACPKKNGYIHTRKIVFPWVCQRLDFSFFPLNEKHRGHVVIPLPSGHLADHFLSYFLSL